MEQTIGTRIAARRKEKGFTQEEVAQRLGVSAQAVSKWENDTSCPDISLLVPLAELLGTTVDALLSEKKENVQVLPPEQRKNIDEMTLHIVIHDGEDGGDLRVNLPMALVRVAVEMGMQLPQVSSNESLKSVDIGAVFKMAESGIVGKLMDMEAGDGSVISILVD